MTDRTLRGLGFMLLATTALTAAPAFAQDTTGQSPAPNTNATDVTGETPAEQVANDGVVADESEIVITATKREENLQDVPISVTVLGTRKLDQLNISNFEEYSKQLPSVSFQTAQPGYTVVYMRGVATGGDGNHSGSLPSVGTYLDEQPVTTIGGTLDVHIYDVARIESLAGPQGTLYGASSQAGTIRIITNKPEIGVTVGRLDGEVNKVTKGGFGGNVEGMYNFALGDRAALRVVAFYQKDAGYIDNVLASRSYDYPGGGISFNNAPFTKKDFNTNEVYGGRVALKVDLDDNWTVLPQFMYQKQKSKGVWFEEEALGDLQVARFQKEPATDRFWQAALTLEGKIANFFDVTYAGAYMDRPRYAASDYTDYTDAYNQYYIDYYNSYFDTYGYAPSFCVGPGILGCQVYRDNAGNLISPRQFIVGTDHFKKMSHELRVATPADRPIRAIVGAFYQRQTNHILQDYMVADLADNLSVDGWPGTIWLTNQRRKDKDYALFGEVSADVVPTVTLTAGGRLYKFDNSLYGFAGFGAGNPGGFSTGQNRCLTVNGLQARNDPLAALATGDSGLDIPCYNVADVVNGKAVPRRSKDSGAIYRFNAQWKPSEPLMFYATWSKGFRPGGINRQPDTPGYAPDFLVNYEIGWKTQLAGNRIRWNGALYHQKWEGLQFSYLGANSLTVIQNGRDAKINGWETDFNYVEGGLSLTAALAYTNAKTSGNICNAAISVDPSPDCTGLDSRGRDDYVVVPSGTRLPVTPKLKGSMIARYSWPMWAGKSHVQGVLAHQGSAPSNIRVADAQLLGKLRASTTVDLFAGYDWGNYSLEMFGTNVFDSRNELSRSVGCSICTQVRIVNGRPQTFGLRAGMKF